MGKKEMLIKKMEIISLKVKIWLLQLKKWVLFFIEEVKSGADILFCTGYKPKHMKKVRIFRQKEGTNEQIGFNTLHRDVIR